MAFPQGHSLLRAHPPAPAWAPPRAAGGYLLRRGPLWAAGGPLGSVNASFPWLLLPTDSSLFMALTCFPELSFPSVPQSAVGLTQLWEPFHVVSLFTALTGTPHPDPREQLRSLLR